MSIKSINPLELSFDKKNPRLVEYDLSNKSEDELAILLWKALDAREIAMSIAASGYFGNDPLIVLKDGNIVIEGNRRLAAIKVLSNRKKFERNIPDIPDIKQRELDTLKSIPIFYQTREESWKFLGFKHVKGSAKWDGYAKAKYIADVRNEYGTRLKEISLQIGDTHNTVRKLYYGLMVVEQGEREGVFDRNDIYAGKFYFSHIYTAIQRAEYKKFLNLKPLEAEDNNPVPKDNIENLKLILNWLYGSKSNDETSVIASQNPDLKNLGKVIQNHEAIGLLKEYRNLTLAFEATVPQTELLEKSLLRAKEELRNAKKHSTEGYDGSEELLRLTGTIANLADDIYKEMDRKYNKNDDRQRLTEANDGV